MIDPPSPLTGSTRVETVRSYSRVELRRAWQRRFGIDVSCELPADSRLTQWRCQETQLEFFVPAMAGSPELYQQLSAFGWYHDVDRWEFHEAMKWFGDARRVLDVGAGSGAFLDLLERQLGCDAVGLESNPVTAAQARAKGHQVYSESLDSFGLGEKERFDAVCAFQVLEHVDDPLGFARSMRDHLAPGGVLVLGVPNADCFIRHWRINLLDMPPHHLTRWHVQTLRALAPLLNLQLVTVETESLTANHAVDFVEAQVLRVLPVPLLPRVIGRRVGTGLSRLPGLRRHIAGHTLMAVYRRAD